MAQTTPLNPINDPAHWKNRAEEARAAAEGMNNQECRRLMLGIADDYELMAARAAARLRQHVAQAAPVKYPDLKFG